MNVNDPGLKHIKKEYPSPFPSRIIYLGQLFSPMIWFPVPRALKLVASADKSVLLMHEPVGYMCSSDQFSSCFSPDYDRMAKGLCESKTKMSRDRQYI
jgi:hypothetical protein